MKQFRLLVVFFLSARTICGEHYEVSIERSRCEDSRTPRVVLLHFGFIDTYDGLLMALLGPFNVSSALADNDGDVATTRSEALNADAYYANCRLFYTGMTEEDACLSSPNVVFVTIHHEAANFWDWDVASVWKPAQITLLRQNEKMATFAFSEGCDVDGLNLREGAHTSYIFKGRLVHDRVMRLGATYA